MSIRKKTTVGTLMQMIANADVDPPVFRVSLSATDHTSGYTAYVTFRKPDERSINTIETGGDTPEEALEQLWDVLINRFGRCPHCGRAGDRQREED